MVKKLQKMAQKKSAYPSGLLDGQLAGSVKDSAQQIWLAGMGAFSKAQQEGSKVFEALVKEGLSLQRKTQAVAEEKIGEVTDRMSSMAGTVTAKAGQNWDKLESIFEARTAKAMNRMGVPTAKDVQVLTQRVDELAAAVAKLGKTTARAAAAPAAAAPRKAVARKARSVAPVVLESAEITTLPVAKKAPARRAPRKVLAA